MPVATHSRLDLRPVDRRGSGQERFEDAAPHHHDLALVSNLGSRERQGLLGVCATYTPGAAKPRSCVTTMLVRPGSARPIDSQVGDP